MKRKRKEESLPAKPNPNAVLIYGKPGSDSAADLAEAYLRPTVQAGSTVRVYNKGQDGSGPDINALIAELGKQTQAVNGGDLSRGEAMLIAQAHSLDAIFGYLARRAAPNFNEYLNAAETYLRLALKAQSQCRATLETLAAIKNPPIVYARQANIANGPQQVNNGLANSPCTRETETLQNGLLEPQHGERLDAAAPGEAGKTNSSLETVGAVHRP